LKQEDDIALFRRLQNDDKPAFDVLFRKYYKHLCRFAFSLNSSETAAEEAVQEVFINIWDQRHHVSVSKSLDSYLFQAVRNKVYEQFRKVQTRAKYEEEYIANIPEYDEPQDNSMNNYEIACLIWNAVEQLPDKCKEIFQLSRDEGLTYNEIAAHLNISAKTVENQMGIAFKKLREILSPMMNSKNKTINQMGLLLFWVFVIIYAGFVIRNGSKCTTRWEGELISPKKQSLKKVNCDNADVTVSQLHEYKVKNEEIPPVGRNDSSPSVMMVQEWTC
jgi:RNA polymerase sigma-70 factor, ECF subfamily